jgi:L-aminopeptidase/D-esterase-like protein
MSYDSAVGRFMYHRIMRTGDRHLTTMTEKGANMQSSHWNIKPEGKPARYPGAITDVPGIVVGHAHDNKAHTGCTVIVAEQGAVCGVDVRGSAPGTRETELLQPTALVQHIHALCLSGGSAFGLAAAQGVMQRLQEQGIGLDVGVAKVPIVPSAILFDLAIGNPTVVPTAEMGYVAVENATSEAVAEGNVGAGAGATLGKFAGVERAMKGGFGTASVQLPNGLVIGAAVAVNAVGEVRHPKHGTVLAGARADEKGQFIDPLSFLTQLANPFQATMKPGTNTTIAAIACNGTFTKTEMTKIAQMAHNGLARTIYPVHTMYDGDTVFAMTTGGIDASVDLAGMWAAEVLAYAVHNAIIAANSVEGVPCSQEWLD